MPKTNLAVIQDLRNFISNTLSDSVNMKECISDDKVFTRRRILSLPVLLLLILRGLKRSLGVELQEFIETTSNGQGYTESAFCQQ